MTPPHYFLWAVVLGFSIFAYISKDKKTRLFVIVLFLSLTMLRLMMFGSNARGLISNQAYNKIEYEIYHQGISDLLSIINGEILHIIGIYIVIFILCIRSFKESNDKQKKTEL